MVKKGYFSAQDGFNENKSLDYFQNCKKQKVIPIPAFIKIKDHKLYLT
jgi:hypothetical protein